MRIQPIDLSARRNAQMGIKMIWNQFSKKNQENYTIYAYEIAGTYTSELTDIAPKHLIRMGERWRSDIDMAWNINWQKVSIGRKQLPRLNDTEYLTILKLGTFHGNGYYRQKCMEALASYEGTLSFVMLRLNDWVSPIRESAFVLCDILQEKTGIIPDDIRKGIEFDIKYVIV